MLRKMVGVGLVFLLVVGVTTAQDKQKGKGKRQGNFVFGKVVALDVKDGTGTVTVMGRKARNEEPKEMKFKVTKDTKFVKGGRPGQEGTAVEADQLANTFKKDATVAIGYKGEGDDLTATRVSAVTPRRRPQPK